MDLTKDVGFKMTFGDPNHPELILGLLRHLIPERDIESIDFLNTEALGDDDNEKVMRFDILCHERDGAYFVVEMQKNDYEYFTDRLVVYAGTPLKKLLKKGEEYTYVKPLYIVSILDYVLELPGDKVEDSRKLVRKAVLRMADNGVVLSNKLNYIFLQMPLISKLSRGQEFLEMWSYTIRNISSLKEKPAELEDAYFDRLFEIADRGNIGSDKLTIYDRMIRDEIQIKAEKDYAVRKAKEQGLADGMEKGMEKGKEESARNLKALGVDVEIICKATGLTREQVEAL